MQIPAGIIEGFFGKSWSWEARRSYASFLKEHDFDFYIYAPKDDKYLRKQWQEPWPIATIDELTRLGELYRQCGLRLGIGLSPFELHLNDPANEIPTLQAKAREINAVKPDIVCILFDDMRGDMPELAQRQRRIVDTICEESTANSFIVCPTYYSFDPLLEKVFGKAPKNYLQDFAHGLDPRVNIFWTGPVVCSRSYPEAHLQQVTEQLGRKPFLWDNYPVNDSATMAPFIHIGPFEDRPAQLQDLIAGHAVNPMNQPWLSRIPVQSLADSYRLGADYRPARAFASACGSVGCGALAAHLINDRANFETIGLNALSHAEKQSLQSKYQPFSDQPAALEVLQWLAGQFEFDPACLT